VRVVVDPGVLIAGLITPAGVCGEIVYGMVDHYTAIVSPTLLEELEEVLRRPKFRRYLSEAEVQTAVRAVGELAEHADDDPAPPTHTPDPADDYLLALAIKADADLLVSGDRHLTEMVGTEIPIVSPRDFVDLLRARAAGS
jgi:uncharacterized protein